MANATFKFVINNQVPLGEKNQKTVRYYGTITFSSASDVYRTGGMSPTAGFALKNLGPYGDRTPLAVYVESQAGSAFQYEYNVSTGKLQVFTGNSSGSATTSAPELSDSTALSGTTPAISTDVINFEVVFPAR